MRRIPPAVLAGVVALVFLSFLLFKVLVDRGVDNTAPGALTPPSVGAVVMLVSPTPPLQRPTPTAEVLAPTLAKATPAPLVAPSAPSPLITALADGSPEAVLRFTESGQQTVYLKVPSEWELASARMDLAGGADAVEQLDQKNESSRPDGTWGVRAQQFRPSSDVLTSVELFLARTSSKPGDLTVEIRDDDGKGYPSTSVLTAVKKPVSAGDYRWEVFDFPDAEVKPNRPYWIVNYVKPLQEIAYPAVPSVGDYGYYVGMSLQNEYAGGGSADFLTFAGGSRWEEYASRSGWDLMFRVYGLVQRFPNGSWLDVGSDGVIEWSHPGELRGGDSIGNLSSAMGDFLHAHRSVAGADTLVPLLVGAESPGVITISNVLVAGKAIP